MKKKGLTHNRYCPYPYLPSMSEWRVGKEIIIVDETKTSYKTLKYKFLWYKSYEWLPKVGKNIWIELVKENNE